MPGVTQPAPSYQPYRPLPPLMGVGAPPKPSRGGLTSMLAGILALVTAGLAVGGSFAPITSYRNTYEGSGDTTVTANDVGWWGLHDAGSSSPFETENLLFGLALVLVAVLLVLGAVFAFVASRTRVAGATTGGRSLITAGVGVLAGVMLLESLQVMENASNYNSRELEPGESLEFSVGLGFVLPLCAVALGVIAVVLAHVGQGQRAFRVEPNTPRMGFPAPYGYQGGVPVAGMAVAGAPVVGAPAGAPAVGAPAPVVSEQPTEVELGASDDESGETTQVVSNAEASGQGSVAAGLSGDAPAPVTPPAAPAIPAEQAAPVTPVPPANIAPVDAEPPATPEEPAPATPATPGTPATSGAPAAPSTPANVPPASSVPPAGSEPPANSESSATPEPSPAAPASEAPQPAATPLTDLPAAPPAPELSEEANKDGK